MTGEPGLFDPDDTRDPSCVEAWPECESGAYNPRCCRFPKSCSCESHNIVTPEAARDEAIDRVEDHAREDWMIAAIDAIVKLSNTFPEDGFCGDDVWELLDTWNVPRPHEGRAMGAAMRTAGLQKLIRPTGVYRKSKRVERHAGPMMIWKRVDA